MHLRYYAPSHREKEHKDILDLLKQIEDEHGIEWEEVPIREKDWYRKTPEMTPTEVYEKHLKPQTKVIKRNDPRRETAASKFKTNSGYVIVSGVIAVIEDDNVIWATNTKPIEFLEKIKEEGEEALEEFEKGRGIEDIHSNHFKWLKEHNLPEKDVAQENKFWFREVTLGFSRCGINRNDIRIEYDQEVAKQFTPPEKKHYQKMCELNLIEKECYRRNQQYLSSKLGFLLPLHVVFADFMVVVGDSAWVIEGKNKLNYKAIGQVLVYRDLMREDYPSFKEIKMGIICKSSNPLLEGTCQKLGIELFITADN